MAHLVITINIKTKKVIKHALAKSLPKVLQK